MTCGLPQSSSVELEFLGSWNGRRRIALLGTHGHNMNDAKRVVSPAVMGPTSEADYDSVRRAGGIFYVIHSSVLFARSDFEAVGGYSTDYGAADEFDFFCRMADQGVVINLPEPLVYYRKRAGSMQLDSFWDKQHGAWRVAENQRRRVVGKDPIGPAEFAAQTGLGVRLGAPHAREERVGYVLLPGRRHQHGQRQAPAGRLGAAAGLAAGRRASARRRAQRPPRPACPGHALAGRGLLTHDPAMLRARAVAAAALGRRPRLLLITPDYPPAHGGIQRTAHRLATGVTAMDTRVVALAHPDAGSFDRAASGRGEAIALRRAYSDPRLRGARNGPLNAVALHEALRFRPDVTLSLHLVASPAAAAIRRALGARTVQYFHAKEIPAKARLAAFAAAPGGRGDRG